MASTHIFGQCHVFDEWNLKSVMEFGLQNYLSKSDELDIAPIYFRPISCIWCTKQAMYFEFQQSLESI